MIRRSFMTGSVSGGDDLPTSTSGLFEPHVFVLLVIVPHVSGVPLLFCFFFNRSVHTI